MATAPTAAETRPPSFGRRTGYVLLTLVLVTHGVQAFRLFPTARAFLDDDHPVLVVDHAIHLYHGALGSRFLREHGTTWGYDPYFMAGYPETPVWDSSSNLSILFQALAGGGYHPRAYNIGLLACSILTLAAIPAGATAAGLSALEVALGALLAWVYFRCGWPDMLWRSGLFSFITASGGVVLLIGVALRFERRPSAGRWSAVAGTGAVVCFAHVTAPILALGAVLGFTATAARRHSWRWLAALVSTMIVAGLANLFWLAPLWRFRGLRVGEGFFMTSSSAWFLLADYLRPGVDSRLGLIILILGFAGLAGWLREGQRVRAATFGTAALLLLALIAFGGLWSATKTLEPLRFKAPLHLLLAVPAGSALARFTAWLAGRRRWGGLFAGATWGVVLVALFLAMPWFFVATARQMTSRRPLVAGLRTQMKTLVGWLQANTDSSARILFEDQLRLLENRDPESTHWTPLLPFLLRPDQRLFIGGLYHSAFIAHHQLAAFGDFSLGPQSIDRWTPEALRAYCERFNIGCVVCWSPLSRFHFDCWAQAKRIATLPRFSSPDQPVSGNEHEWRALTALGGKALAERYMIEGEHTYVIYRVDRRHSYFLQGEGSVGAVDFNRIELTDVVPHDGAVIVGLHWLDTRRTEPPLPIEPAPMDGDPVPFVRISTTQPIKRIVLFNGYGRTGP
jgi:hypothetical protein